MFQISLLSELLHHFTVRRKAYIFFFYYRYQYIYWNQICGSSERRKRYIACTIKVDRESQTDLGMIPRLFLDYHLPTLNFKLQLHTYPPVRSTLSYLTYSLVPFVIRLDVKLFFTIDHAFFFFAHLGPHQSDTACSSRLVLCSRMPSPPLQSFFTPNPRLARLLDAET